MQWEDILDNIVNHPDVQFSWSIVCAPLDDEYMVAELLKQLVDLWLTIHGFSEAGFWMEYYKQCKMECTWTPNIIEEEGRTNTKRNEM